jgi:hypothetical protein
VEIGFVRGAYRAIAMRRTLGFRQLPMR